MKKYLLFIPIFVLVSCKKDDLNPEPLPEVICDTTFIESPALSVLPSEYLMAYPGSWWEYDGGNKIECVDWVSFPVYKKSQNESGCLIVEKQCYTLPLIKDSLDNDYVVSGANRIYSDSSNFEQQIFKQIGELGQTWGYTYQTKYSNHKYDTETRIKWKCDSSFATKFLDGNLYNDVIYIEQEVDYHHFHENHSFITVNGYYYARYIGLVKVSCISDDWGWNYERSLTDYYIAPH